MTDLEKAYLSELKDYGETVERLRKEIERLKAMLTTVGLKGTLDEIERLKADRSQVVDYVKALDACRQKHPEGYTIVDFQQVWLEQKDKRIRELEATKSQAVKYAAHISDNWKQICESDVFQELKHGKYRGVMQLLQDGEISVGKAAQAIAEIAHGVTPVLPDYELRDGELSWKEQCDRLRKGLRRVEYCGPGDTCPVCGYFTPEMEDMKRAGIVKHVGHANNCIIGVALLEGK